MIPILLEAGDNVKVELDNEIFNFSEYQLGYMLGIQMRPDFSHFISPCPILTETPRDSGVSLIVWIEGLEMLCVLLGLDSRQTKEFSSE